MKRSKRTLMIGATCAALASLGGGYAFAGGLGEDEKEGPDVAITGAALAKASTAALAAVGEGAVTATEINDEDGKYEVEVTRRDGSEVDVALDASFTVLGTEDEDDESGAS